MTSKSKGRLRLVGGLLFLAPLLLCASSGAQLGTVTGKTKTSLQPPQQAKDEVVPPPP